MMPFFPPVARSVPFGGHARVYTWLTGLPASAGGVPVEESTVFLPQLAQVRLRNRKIPIVETKKEGGFLIIISPDTVHSGCIALDSSGACSPLLHHYCARKIGQLPGLALMSSRLYLTSCFFFCAFPHFH